MEYRQLGRAGVRVSVIGLGTNRYGTDKLPRAEVNTVEALAAWAEARGRGLNVKCPRISSTDLDV